MDPQSASLRNRGKSYSMKIPFSLPVIDNDVIAEMEDTLLNTGWLTSGPKVVAFEEELRKLTTSDAVVCVNSWTSGAMLVLRWLGVGQGDEVIIPAYTYAATALACLNIGATPVMVDVTGDYIIDVTKIRRAISTKTKVVIPVDIGGWPCDYGEILEIVSDVTVAKEFRPSNAIQERLGRILVLADAAHSLGARYRGLPVGMVADVTVFSFHSVKNVTTGEGGAVCLNLPSEFSPDDEYNYLKALSLNGQTKSAFEKNQKDVWRYDIIDQGLKVNLPDLCAAVGLAQIRKYESELLPERKSIFQYYSGRLSEYDWAILPQSEDSLKVSSCHLYLLRIDGFSEEQRDRMIVAIGQMGVGVNVHYIPLPMMTLFKNLGYKMHDYPVTFELYENEITLPVYNGLTIEQQEYVINCVIKGYEQTIGT